MPFFVHFIFLPFRAFFVVTTCILRLFGAFFVYYLFVYFIMPILISTIFAPEFKKKKQ